MSRTRVTDLGGVGEAVAWIAIFFIAYLALPKIIEVITDAGSIISDRNAARSTDYDPQAALDYVLAQATLGVGVR